MYKYVKRILDFIVSLIALIVLLPIVIVLSILIKMEDGEKVIFVQKRTGYKGKIINIYKFRTMKINNNVLEFTNEDEKTKIGQIIRKFSLDEIPQLINILKGDMSFIGPRPWIPEYYDNFTPEQKRRCDVLPGLSGLAQINGRNNITIFEKIGYDLHYVENQSFALDLKILIFTIIKVLKKDGAISSKFKIKNELIDLKKQTTCVEEKMEYKYSVLMSIYKDDKIEYIKQSIESMLKQTIKPDEFLICVNGQVPIETKQMLEEYKKTPIINIKYFEQSISSGAILGEGVKLAKNELIARIDAGDVSVPERCELELKEFKKKNDLDLVGGFFSALNEIGIEEIIDLQEYPTSNEEIRKSAKKNKPFAHSTVMFKKSTVMKCGNYRDLELYEDYDLWSRMIINNCKFANINKVILMRKNKDFDNIRKENNYLKNILSFKFILLQRDFYKITDFTVSILIHIVVCLIPQKLQTNIYLKHLKNKNSKIGTTVRGNKLLEKANSRNV